jgi:cytidine deaminase
MTPGELVAAARSAATGAYAPYSGFRVGAAVLGRDGRVVTSANVENAAYPVSQCAEANAVSYAVSQGVRDIVAVAVACVDAASVDGAYPCGRCRQIMSEFDVETVYVTGGDDEVRRHTLDELLPHRFSF